jgi:Xaa-Pro aminopeptidase
MSDLFTSDFFAGNRERLRQLFTGTAPIVVTANGLLQKGSDEAMPFHQDRSFWFLTGCDEPDVLLVMDRDKEYLIVPKREWVKETFDGAVDVDSSKRISGIADIVDDKEGWHRLEKRLKKVKNVATLAAAPKYIDVFGMYANPARGELIRRIKKLNSDVELLDLRPHISRLRMIKQQPELAAIQEAIDITIATLKEISRPSKLSKYAFEYEIEADLTRGFRRRGALGHGFDPVVASGKHACTMHHVVNNGALASDELLIIDAGADAHHYSADVTRTYSLNGQPSRRQEAVHAAVLKALEFACNLLKPGVVYRSYEEQMEKFVGEKLRELGLIKTIERDIVRKFFPHRTSHFLGLDTHDAGDYERTMEPGMVFAVEPGIYIPEEGIGVRIEDDVVITADGNKNLSGMLPRTLA